MNGDVTRSTGRLNDARQSAPHHRRLGIVGLTPSPTCPTQGNLFLRPLLVYAFQNKRSLTDRIHSGGEI